MKYRIICLSIIFCSLQIVPQTILRHNKISFPNGTGFEDTVSTELSDLGIDTVPYNISYEDYLDYVHGFTLTTLGTVNALGGTATNVLFGHFVGDYSIPTGDNVYSGIQGLTEDGKKGSNLDSNPIDFNAFSDVQISKAQNEESIWLRSNSNDINQIDAYKSIDVAFEPVGSQALALQAEAGDINIQNKFVVKSTTTSNRGKVGIGTTTPTEELHVVGNVKVKQLFGFVGKIIPLDYYDNIDNNDGIGNSNDPKNGSASGGQGGFLVTGPDSATFETVGAGYEINCYFSEFNTNDWNTSMKSLIFLSWFASTLADDGSGRGDLLQFKMFLYKNETMASIMSKTDAGVSAPVAESAMICHDFYQLCVDKDFTLFLGTTLDPNTNYVVKLVCANVTTGHSLQYTLYRFSGAIYAAPSL